MGDSESTPNVNDARAYSMRHSTTKLVPESAVADECWLIDCEHNLMRQLTSEALLEVILQHRLAQVKTMQPFSEQFNGMCKHVEVISNSRTVMLAHSVKLKELNVCHVILPYCTYAHAHANNVHTSPLASSKENRSLNKSIQK